MIMGYDDVVANFTAQLIARGWTTVHAEYIAHMAGQLELTPLLDHDPELPLTPPLQAAVARAQSWLDAYANGA